MDRLGNFLNGLAIAIAAVAASAVHYAEQSVDLSLWAVLVVDAFVITFVLTVGKEVLASTLLEWTFLRRLLLGREFVEGTWIDVVCYPDRPPQIGIVNFSSHGSGLVYFGENLDLDGRHVNQFSTRAVEMSFPTLTFHYNAGGSGWNGPFLGGLGSITFDRQNGGPTNYTGECFDAMEGHHRLIASRVIGRVDLQRLGDPASRVATALALAQPLLKQCPGLEVASSREDEE